eukprot:gene55103-36877_t
MALNIADYLSAAPPPTAAARGAVLAALAGDDDTKLNSIELDDAFTSTSTLVTSRGGAMGKATLLGGVLQEAPGGQCIADLVAGALTRKELATLTMFANSLAATWDAAAQAGRVRLAPVPDRVPYQTYYTVLGNAGIDPVTRGLVGIPALTGLGAVGEALQKVGSYMSLADTRPEGESVMIFELTKMKGASGIVSFAPSELTWHAGARLTLPLDSAAYITAKGLDGQYLPQRPIKPFRGLRIGSTAQGVRQTTCFDAAL